MAGSTCENRLVNAPQGEAIFIVNVCTCVCLSPGVELGVDLSSQVDEALVALQEKQKDLQLISDHTHTHLEQSLQLTHLHTQVKQVYTDIHTYTLCV